MNITGIIAEYNIFHNGHKYQIDEIKKRSDAVVAVMSGSFVQRGDVAITDKWSRAKAALFGGVDLVIELPVCYALNAAPNFATGGINILNALGVVNNICFGSESGCIYELISAAELLENENSEISKKIKKYVMDGMSYPNALTKAYSALIPSDILSEPNNILATEYIRALIRSDSKIKPMTVKRHKAGYHDRNLYQNIASATKLREMKRNNENINDFIPYKLEDINCDIPYDISNLDSAIISKLRLMTAEDLQNISEVTEGIENRILSSANMSYSFETLVENVKNKRYTTSKIRRMIISALIGFTKDIYSPMPQYIRILGMNKVGMTILKQAKGICKVPIITKTADFKEQSPQFNLDVRATNIAMLCNPIPTHRIGNADLKKSPIIMK